MAKKLAWQCSKGHIFDASPNKRSSGRGCPYSARRLVAVGETDLATTHPELAATAFGWDPKTVLSGSSRKVEWLCERKSAQPHTWTMAIEVRVRGEGCSICAGKQIVVSINELGHWCASAGGSILVAVAEVYDAAAKAALVQQLELRMDAGG